MKILVPYRAFSRRRFGFNRSRFRHEEGLYRVKKFLCFLLLMSRGARLSMDLLLNVKEPADPRPDQVYGPWSMVYGLYSGLEEPNQLDPDLVEAPAVRIPFIMQQAGDLGRRLELRFRVLLDLEVHHFLDQSH